MNWDYTLTVAAQLLHPAVRGARAGHARDPGQPLHRRALDMSVADLGKPPFRGGPLSHGCLRMAAVDAEYIYDNLHPRRADLLREDAVAGGRPDAAVRGRPVRATPSGAGSLTWAAPAVARRRGRVLRRHA